MRQFFAFLLVALVLGDHHVILHHNYARRTEDVTRQILSRSQSADVIQRYCNRECLVEKLWFHGKPYGEKCFYIIRRRLSDHPQNVFDANCENNDIVAPSISSHAYGDVISSSSSRGSFREPFRYQSQRYDRQGEESISYGSRGYGDTYRSNPHWNSKQRGVGLPTEDKSSGLAVTSAVAISLILFL